MGNDALILASVSEEQRTCSVRLERVNDWDLSRQNTVFGGCALGQAVYMGANKLETVKVLLDAGASVDYRTFSGGSALTNAVENEDSDPAVVRIILEKLKSSCSPKEFASIVNYKRKSTTLKWKGIYFCCKGFVSTRCIENWSPCNLLQLNVVPPALNHAVMRGDVEIVKILLANGADPYIENDLASKMASGLIVADKTGPLLA